MPMCSESVRDCACACACVVGVCMRMCSESVHAHV